MTYFLMFAYCNLGMTMFELHTLDIGFSGVGCN